MKDITSATQINDLVCNNRVTLVSFAIAEVYYQ